MPSTHATESCCNTKTWLSASWQTHRRVAILLCNEQVGACLKNYKYLWEAVWSRTCRAWLAPPDSTVKSTGENSKLHVWGRDGEMRNFPYQTLTVLWLKNTVSLNRAWARSGFNQSRHGVLLGTKSLRLKGVMIYHGAPWTSINMSCL